MSSYLCLKLSSEHVDGPAAGQERPLFLQPVLKAEGWHHIQGVHLERRLPEDFICSTKDNYEAILKMYRVLEWTIQEIPPKNSLGSGFPVLCCFDAKNLPVRHQSRTRKCMKTNEERWGLCLTVYEERICLTLWLSARAGSLDSHSRTISQTVCWWCCPHSTWRHRHT